MEENVTEDALSLDHLSSFQKWVLVGRSQILSERKEADVYDIDILSGLSIVCFNLELYSQMKFWQDGVRQIGTVIFAGGSTNWHGLFKEQFRISKITNAHIWI